MNSKTKIALLFSFFVSHPVLALEKEYKIKKPSSKLPEIIVLENEEGKKWRMYDSSGVNFVYFHDLGMKEALYLMEMADKALDSYKEIIDQGRCPKHKVKSGILGELKRFSKLEFEVVCERNNILLHMRMFDRHIVNSIYNKVEAKDLKEMAGELIAALNGSSKLSN